MSKTLFNEKDFSGIKTQGIKYAGSKLKIIPYILESIKDLEIKTVLDGFSGSTRVSQAFAQAGYDVISNDVAYWSEVCAQCFLLHEKEKKYYQNIIDELNSIKGYGGWFTANYGGDEAMGVKMPFQIKNTKKLDAIRDRIEELKLNEVDKSVILTSLIFALDSVDSTLGHFVSYLSKWSKRSFNDLFLKLPDLKETTGNHKVLRKDIFEIGFAGEQILFEPDNPRLQGHPHRDFLPMLETSSGPLACGLSQAVGMALSDKIDHGLTRSRRIADQTGGDRNADLFRVQALRDQRE